MQSSRRTAKMAEVLRQELSRLLMQEIEKPALATAWISQVKVTGDLRKAYVWYRLREASPRRAEAEFPKVVSYFRKRLAQELDMRYVPELEFKFDAEGEQRDRVLGLLHGFNGEQHLNSLPSGGLDDAR